MTFSSPFFNAFILSYYQEPHRSYHDERHIDEMTGLASRMGFALTNEQLLAVWFHDIVYVPGSPHNEVVSAGLMRTIVAQNDAAFRAAFDGVDLGLAETIILDTRKHAATHEQSRLVLDLDMAIMGSSPERYADYVQGIRYEFSAFSQDAFFDGRAKFLKSILQTRFFNLDTFHDKFDAIAQKNIQAELLSMGR